MKATHPLFLLLFAVGLTGCDFSLKPKKVVSASPVPSSTPKPIQRLRGDRLKMFEAMKYEDLSFMLRTGNSEADVLTAIEQRGLLDNLTAPQVKLLETDGASGAVLAAVRDPRNVLTFDERAEYYRREQERNMATRGAAFVDTQRRAADFAERQRMIDLQQKSLNEAAQKERQAREREQAKRDYESRRAFLDKEKERIQALMNSYRKSGYREDQLTSFAQELKKVEEERSRLKSP